MLLEMRNFDRHCTTLLVAALIAAAIGSSCSGSHHSAAGSKEEAKIYGLSGAEYADLSHDSAPGGSLDFASSLPAKQFFIIGGLAYNRADAALVRWGEAARKRGVPSADDAVALYEKIRARKLQQTERRALVNGFNLKSDS